MPDVWLFAGPSAYGIPKPSLLKAGVRLLPPVRRGDVDRIVVRTGAPCVVVICDGIFHSEPAVSHAEICRAIDGGCTVWGVSSIGAIRAHELRAEGMKGFGYVYSMFSRMPDFTDDEMCQLHLPEEPYLAVSEPLVNLRFALEQRRRELRISEGSERRLLGALRTMWFGDRTESKMRELMVQHAGIDARAADMLLTYLKHNRIKTLDLAELMALRPWSG